MVPAAIHLLPLKLTFSFLKNDGTGRLAFPFERVPFQEDVSQLSDENNLPTFHYTACFIRILIMVYFNPHNIAV